MDSMDGIRSRIDEVVKRSGLSDREFGRRAGLASETHIGLIVSGKTKDVQVRTLELIAAFAGVSVEYLRTGRADRAPMPELDEHGDPAFRTAGMAFLELREFSADAKSVVVDYAKATTGRQLTIDEWFEELLTEHRRRGRGLSLPYGGPMPVAPPETAPVAPARSGRSGRAKSKSKSPALSKR